MGCTTILVGKNASYDGSTLVARNDDSGGSKFDPKKLVMVHPKDQPSVYRSVLSHVEIPLPEKAMRYSAVPDALTGSGVWPACGINEANVAMTATETITSNERVLGADPLVPFQPVKKRKLTDDTGDIRRSTQSFREEELPGEEKAGGIGEEDIVLLVLPYIYSAREGVERLGSLLKQYGTYEMNGIAFQDRDEIWWMETIGGHHWIAKKVPDDAYVMMPNQQGIDDFDLDDALGEKKEHMCSEDMREFIKDNFLNLSLDGFFHARYAFGSRADSDHTYNTCRAWAIGRYLNSRSYVWDGEDADYRPEDDDIPWSLWPDRKITIEDIKYILSNHYQGTPYDPYEKGGFANKYRPIGVNRTSFLSITQIRPYAPEEYRSLQWITFASNVFNAIIPFYANTDCVPEYLSNTTDKVSTDNYYWTIRLIGALADPHFNKCAIHIERYQLKVHSRSHELVRKYDRAIGEGKASAEDANREIADMLKEETEKVLLNVLNESSMAMKNAFARSDA